MYHSHYSWYLWHFSSYSTTIGFPPAYQNQASRHPPHPVLFAISACATTTTIITITLPSRQASPHRSTSPSPTSWRATCQTSQQEAQPKPPTRLLNPACLFNLQLSHSLLTAVWPTSPFTGSREIFQTQGGEGAGQSLALDTDPCTPPSLLQFFIAPHVGTLHYVAAFQLPTHVYNASSIQSRPRRLLSHTNAIQPSIPPPVALPGSLAPCLLALGLLTAAWTIHHHHHHHPKHFHLPSTPLYCPSLYLGQILPQGSLYHPSPSLRLYKVNPGHHSTTLFTSHLTLNHNS